jgi:hypothetical protein
MLLVADFDLVLLSSLVSFAIVYLPSRKCMCLCEVDPSSTFNPDPLVLDYSQALQASSKVQGQERKYAASYLLIQ